MVDPLGRYRARANRAAAGDREAHRRGRGGLWRRNGGREKGPLPVPLDATRNELSSVGTGVFGGWREDVGNELDHDVHATMMARGDDRTACRHDGYHADRREEEIVPSIQGGTRFEAMAGSIELLQRGCFLEALTMPAI